MTYDHDPASSFVFVICPYFVPLRYLFLCQIQKIQFLFYLRCCFFLWISGIGLNNHGAFQFPVFHRNHPSFSSWIKTSTVPEATVSRDDSLRENVFFMSINLGTPAVSNLVTIDTGSSLSWVQCGRCHIRCQWQAGSTRPMFNPFNSSTYQNVKCSTEACHTIHKSTGITSVCVDETDPCLYRIRYALGEYSVGYLGKEKLTLPNSVTIDDFIFGCGGDSLQWTQCRYHWLWR